MNKYKFLIPITYDLCWNRTVIQLGGRSRTGTLTRFECRGIGESELFVIHLIITVIITIVVSLYHFRLHALFHHRDHRHLIQIIIIIMIINHTFSAIPPTSSFPSPSPPHPPDASAPPPARPTNPAATNAACAPCVSNAQSRHPRTLP